MAEKPIPDPDFESLLAYIQEARGLDFRGYKRTSLRRRLTLRMEAVGADNFTAYRGHLEAQPSEFEDLLNTVLINVTSFFRDPDAWEVLRDQVIPKLLEDAGSERAVRVWSVGCASGEEPYSIAMLFADAMGMAEFCRRVKIYATDLDDEALKVARAATYTPREVESVPPDYLDKYFERTANHYVFERELRKCVIFGRHNVVVDAPISRIDLLACRNLLIYLEAETQNIVLPRLHYALNANGYLFLGKAETQLARSSLFRPVDMKHRIFAKLPQEWRRPLNGQFTLTRPHGFDAPYGEAPMLDAAIEELSTPLLIVEEDGTVAAANGAARALLGVSGADIGRPFQDLSVSYRPIELRNPIDEVFRTRRGVRLENQEYRLNQSEILHLTVELRPLQRTDGAVYAVLLTFADHTHVHRLQRELEGAQENLEHSIEELQSANEELETTNEELQSTNEELETTNEELQSTNEELETLNEEARSSNEEMESVNEELRLQAEQASSYRLYLESMLRAMNGGIVVLDANRIVRSWNRWSENTWGLRDEEVVGTPFDSLDIGLPTSKLRDAIARVQRGQESAEQQVEGIDRRGRRVLCRVRISALLDDSEANHGTVLVFQDITAERSQEEYARYLGRIMGRALNGIYFLEPTTLRFVLANRGAREKLGYGEEQLKQMALPDVMPGIKTADVHALLAPLMSGAESEIVFETMLQNADGGEYDVEVCMQYFHDEEPPILVAMVQQTAGRRQLRAAG